MMGEISERVSFIQDSLSDLDGQLGQLQDLSALAVDSLTLLSASDSLQQEEARLASCRPSIESQHILPHSWTQLYRSGPDCDVLNIRHLVAKSCKSTPPSLLKGYTLVTSRRTSREIHVARGSRGGRQGPTEEEGSKEVLFLLFLYFIMILWVYVTVGIINKQYKNCIKKFYIIYACFSQDPPSATPDHTNEYSMGLPRPASYASFSHFYGVNLGFRDHTPSESCVTSRCASPLSPRGLDSPYHKLWTWDPCLYPSQEEESMEEEEEGEEDEDENKADEQEQVEKTHKPQSNKELSRSSSCAILLPKCQDGSEGLINPAFSQGDNATVSQSKPCNHWERSMKSPRLKGLYRDRPYGYCRSLSSSMENMTFGGAPISPTRGSFPFLYEQVTKTNLNGERSFRDDTSLQYSRSKGIVLVFTPLFISS